jgi:hypothetical protein
LREAGLDDGAAAHEEASVMDMVRIPRPLAAILIAGAALALAACASQGPVEGPPPTAAPLPAPPPPNMNPADFVGRWGFASYHKPEDRARTEAAARGQCTQAYVISRGPTGGLMMHLADAAQPQELRLKAGPGAKAYIGPEGPAADPKDREIVTFDGRLMILRWVDPEIHTRYGNSVYVRCDAPGAVPARAAKKPKAKKKTPASASPAAAPPPAPPPAAAPAPAPAPR